MTAISWDRVSWWAYILVLAGAAAFIGHSFVGLIVLGVFGYYATRPLSDRLGTVVDSEQLAATLTVLTVLVPVFLVTVYTGIRIVQQLQRTVDESVASTVASRVLGLSGVPSAEQFDVSHLLQNPSAIDSMPFVTRLEQVFGALNAFFGGLLLLGLALTLTYGLLAHDDELSEAFTTLVGGRDTTVYAYARAVDEDLESIFFGNLLFVIIVAVLATVTYAATNMLSPSGLRVPMVLTLGFLTGVASLVPIIVGKLVYLPVVAYLGFRATQLGRGYVFVGGTLVAYILLLDLLPQSVLQPYITGRQLSMLMLLFAYILGPILFGWYGFFLLPILFVLMLETVRIVLPELIHGEPLVPEATVAEDTGSDVQQVTEDSGDGEPKSDTADSKVD